MIWDLSISIMNNTSQWQPDILDHLLLGLRESKQTKTVMNNVDIEVKKEVCESEQLEGNEINIFNMNIKQRKLREII